MNKQDTMHAIQDRYDSIGNDVLDMIAEKTPFLASRKRHNRTKRIATVLTVALGVIAVGGWLASYARSNR